MAALPAPSITDPLKSCTKTGMLMEAVFTVSKPIPNSLLQVELLSNNLINSSSSVDEYVLKIDDTNTLVSLSKSSMYYSTNGRHQ